MDYMVSFDIRETGFVSWITSILSCEPRRHQTQVRMTSDSYEGVMRKAEDRARQDRVMDYNGRAIIKVSEVKVCEDQQIKN